MGVELDPKIPISIEFGSSLRALLNVNQAQEVERRLSSELNVLLQRLGITGEPEIVLRSVDSNRALRVRVHGELQPYSPDLMRRVWRALAPAGLRGLPEVAVGGDQPGFPDAWFKECLTGSDLSGGEPDWELTSEYLARLIHEVIQEQPACLIGPPQVSTYLEEGLAHLSMLSSPVSTENLTRILKSLLNMGVSVGNKVLVLQVCSASQRPGRSVEDVAEEAFALLRPDHIEVQVNPRYLQSLAPGAPMDAPMSVYADRADADLRDLFSFLEQELSSELGIRFPDVVWVPSPEVEEGMIAVKINDRVSPPTPGLLPGELLVDAPVESLAGLEIPGRPVTNPVSENAQSAIVSEAHREIVQQKGYTAWTPLVFTAYVLSNEIRGAADRLLDIDSVEYQLAQLQYDFPELVRAVTAKYSIGDLTRVLRGLVREGLSIRNMRDILEQVLQYDTISTDPTKYIVFDERLPLREGTPLELARGWENYLEFVRSGLKHYVSYTYAQRYNTLYVYLVDQQLTDYLGAVASGGMPAGTRTGLTEAEQEALRDAVWEEVGSAAATVARPVLLTLSGVRAALRELLAPEMPDLPIVAFSELPQGMAVEPTGVITFPQ